MKMGDKFGACCGSVVAEDFGQYLLVNEIDIARFKNRKHTGAVAHAINNHDRMVEEIAELKDLVTLISLNSSFQANMPHETDMVDKLLAKLNQEGEE